MSLLVAAILAVIAAGLTVLICGANAMSDAPSMSFQGKWIIFVAWALVVPFLVAWFYGF